MEIISSVFKLLAGIGLFLFAMHFIEESLKNLSGRNFKLFLQRTTKNKIAAVMSGALVTAVLQSSSMVSLMVLAFVGAGVFTMKNALAIILGANLGTTIDSWLVATLGFKLNIDLIAYVSICVGALILIFFGKKNSWKDFAYFLFGFGLLFIGLSFMRTAMENQITFFDLSKYNSMPLLIFISIGFVITILIQSSSVTMALSLTALHVGTINFPEAAAIVLGSETGTTIKIVLSAIGGNASKKRIVLGNLIFNIFLTILSFIFLQPILSMITDVFQIKNQLIALVTFTSLINLFSIIIFVPILNPFAKFLEKFYKETATSTALFIGNANISEPETALDLFRRETEYFIYNTIQFNLELFDIDTKHFLEKNSVKKIMDKKKYFPKSQEEKYEFMKQLQGEVQAFYLKLKTKLKDEQSHQLNQLISCVRSSMYSMKCLNDIRSNISNLKRSSKNIKYNFFINNKNEIEKLYQELTTLLIEDKKNKVLSLQNIFNKIKNNYTKALNTFYKEAQNAAIENIDITIAINFNRELFTSNKAILMATKDLILNEKQAEIFNENHEYIT